MKGKKPIRKKKRLVVSDEVKKLRRDIFELGQIVVSLKGEIQEWKERAKRPAIKFEGLPEDINRDISDLVSGIENITGLVHKPPKPFDPTKPVSLDNRVDFNTIFDGKLATIAPQSEIDKIIDEAVTDARKTYPVRTDRNAGFVDLYPSMSAQMNDLERHTIATFIANRMKDEQKENLGVIDEELR